MKWSLCRGLVFVAGAAVLACTAESPEERGGFEGDPRPTFQKDNPYESANTVEWREWSERVLTSSSKPILLDISGLWCHYCHLYDAAVYGRESIAAFINEHYTPVRVDADARPDIDARYNEGGWPSLTVLTPEGYPIAGTSFDLDTLDPFFRSGIDRYEAGGDSLRRALALNAEELARRQAFYQEVGDLDPAVLTKVIAGVSRVFDNQYGGFKGPDERVVRLVSEEALYFLVSDVRQELVQTDVDAFLRRTLDAMIDGAVRDHLMGGFHRTVDDRAWTLPHFEKLLETQAWVADAYLAGHARFGEDRYLDIARETIDFVVEMLGNPDGITFSNSIDADVGLGDEGGFYTWSVTQVDSLLSPAEAQVVKFYYGITPSGEIPGRREQNTLFRNATIERTAERLGMSDDDVRAHLESARARMRASRLAGERPRIDSRAFAAPNLRMATALLHASEALGDDTYRERALAVIDFFTMTHLDPETGVPHVFDGVRVGGPELLQSQVAAVEACLAAHDVTDDPSYMERARGLQQLVAASYRNELTGAYWDVPSDASGVGLLKAKDRPLDANVRMAATLMEITARTGDQGTRREAEQTLKAFAESFGRRGLSAVPYALAVHRLVWELRGKSS